VIFGGDVKAIDKVDWISRNIVLFCRRNQFLNSSTVHQLLEKTMTTLNQALELAGRVSLAAIFLLSGVGKVGQYAGTQAYMAAAGVSSQWLPLVIALEVGGALAIILGWRTRAAALILAGFTLLAAVLFHSAFAEQIQMILFLKNVAIAGGFLLLFVHGAGPWSLDARRAG
jgi:putative oxidoreductase